MKRLLFSLVLLTGLSASASEIRISGETAKEIYDALENVAEKDYGSFKEKVGTNVRCSYHSGAYPLSDCYIKVSVDGDISL